MAPATYTPPSEDPTRRASDASNLLRSRTTSEKVKGREVQYATFSPPFVETFQHTIEYDKNTAPRSRSLRTHVRHAGVDGASAAHSSALAGASPRVTSFRTGVSQ